MSCYVTDFLKFRFNQGGIQWELLIPFDPSLTTLLKAVLVILDKYF